MATVARSVNTEIERKFIVKNFPDSIDLSRARRSEILQAYLIANDGDEMRIRKDGAKYFMTVKSGYGLTRKQPEVEINKEQFDTLFSSKCGLIVEKTRYYLPISTATIEVDIYKGALKGLVIAEVEFGTEKAAIDFVPPAWFGREVTYDSRYRNSSLSLRGVPAEYMLNPRPCPSSGTKYEFNEYPLEQGFDELLRKIRAIAPHSSQPIVVLIAGGSASGKTSKVASRLGKRLEDDALVISLDNYYKGKQYVDANKITFDHPDAVDLPLLINHISSLKSGVGVHMPIYSFATSERSIITRQMEPRAVITVEGLFALPDDIRGAGDIGVFVDVGAHGRTIRRLERDFRRSKWAPHETLRYLSSVAEPMYEKYVAPTKSNADLVIRNDYDPLSESRNIEAHDMHIKFPANSITQNMLRDVGCTRIIGVRQLDMFLEPREGNNRVEG